MKPPPSPAANRPVTVPRPDHLRQFLDGGVPLFEGKFARRTLGSAWFVAPPREELPHGQEKRLMMTESNYTQEVDEVNQFAPTNRFPRVVERVNEIREGKAPGPYLDAPFPVQDGEVYLMQPEKFEFCQVRDPTLKAAVIPDGGWDNQPSLVHPLKREQVLKMHVQKQFAEGTLGKETHQKMRTVAQMQKNNPHGVIGVEAPGTEGTLVYKHGREKLVNARNAAGSLLSRKKKEYFERSSEALLGYDMLTQVPPDIPLPPGQPGERKAWPCKRKNAVSENTYKRLFGAGLGFSDRLPGEPKASFVYRPAVERRQVEVRNNDTNGRQYNILSGAAFEHFPPTRSERVNRRQVHPSINVPPVPSHVLPPRNRQGGR